MDTRESISRLSTIRVNLARPIENIYRFVKECSGWKGAVSIMVMLLSHAVCAEAGMVYGEIKCEREVLRRANVTLENTEGEQIRLVTDSNGRYSISLPPGDYRVTSDRKDCVGWLSSSPNAVQQDVVLKKVPKTR